MQEVTESEGNRVFMEVGALRKSPERRESIKKMIASAAEDVAGDLTAYCKSQYVDLFILQFSRDSHPHYTVRVAARDGTTFCATLHVDDEGNVIDGQGNVTKEPFNNGGKKGARKFNRMLYELV